MDSNKKYWKGLEELNKTPEFVEKNKHEFAEPIPIEDVLSGNGLMGKTPRRDFLKAVGFGVGAVTLAACQKVPVNKSIPYLIKPEEVTPGVANYYTSTYDGHAILVKTREGRPIKVEGNPKDIMGRGGVSAQAQASVLDLYDVNRLKNPMRDGAEQEWSAIDSFVKSELAAVVAAGKGIRIISSTIHSPSTGSVIADFIAKYYLYSSCGSFENLESNSIGYTITIRLNAKYSGCICADIVLGGDATYKFKPTQPGVYYLRFVQPNNNYFVDTVTAN